RWAVPQTESVRTASTPRQLHWPPFQSASRTASLPRRLLNGTLALLLLLTGCAVGPNYKSPKTEVSSTFANSAQPSFSSNDVVVTWWRSFNDPRLNSLIERAITNN